MTDITLFFGIWLMGFGVGIITTSVIWIILYKRKIEEFREHLVENIGFLKHIIKELKGKCKLNERKLIEKLGSLNCEMQRGDNKWTRDEDIISLKNKLNLIIDELNEGRKNDNQR